MKMFKVIRSSQSQLEHLPSYFYKNVLFRLSASTDNDDWKGNNSLRDRQVYRINSFLFTKSSPTASASFAQTLSFVTSMGLQLFEFHYKL